MGFRSLPSLLLQTLDLVTSVRPRVLKIGGGLTLVDNKNGTAQLSRSALAASDIASGTIATARLGSGVADATTFLRGDQTYATPAGGGGGSLEIKEADGTPDVTGVTSITVTNGTLTDNGGGSVSLTTGGGGSGTVTSVAATVPTGFSVSGSPVTTSGTLGITLDSQSGNKVLASPSNGTSGTPAMRALVAADIPAIAESGVTSLTSDLALKASIASPTFTGTTTAPEFSASGLTGATAASRYVGATASGAPVSGTFVLGDWIADQAGKRWTCTVGGSPGTWVQEPGTGGGALTLISDTVLGVAAASVTFSSIPGTYKHLRLIGMGRGSASANQIGAQLILNSDSGSNYHSLIGQWYANSQTSVSDTVAATSAQVATFSAANATANFLGMFDITIPAYAGTTFFKIIQSLYHYWYLTSNGNNALQYGSAMWISTAAITAITLSASSGNFVAGSQFTLYGVS